MEPRTHADHPSAPQDRRDSSGLSRPRTRRRHPRPTRRDAVEVPDFGWLSRYYLRVIRPEMVARMLAAERGIDRLVRQHDIEQADIGIEEQDDRPLWQALKELLRVDEWSRMRQAWLRKCKRDRARSGSGSSQ